MGEFKDNKRNGVGILRDSKDRIIKGIYYNGILQDWGFVRQVDKEYEYRGQFDKGLFEGVGEERSGMQKYIGHWKHGEKNGVGFLRLLDSKGRSKIRLHELILRPCQVSRALYRQRERRIRSGALLER